MSGKATFSAADYGVFGGMLLISAGIGVYHAIAGGGQTSTRKFLMADKSMNFLPVALSVLASFFSASTLLGTPAEIYQYGTMYWISVFGAVLTPVTGALLFGPMFFKLKVVSVFEYLEQRYKSKTVRLFGACVFIVRTTVGMGIVLYGPSTALAAVTTFPQWAIIITIGAVCTFYTSIGGIKAVIWTDVFQTLIMVIGMLTIFIKACVNIGGISEVWRINVEGGRVQFFDFDTDPYMRHTFWTLVVGIYFVWLPPYTVDQQMVQRFSSTKTLKQAKLSLLMNVPGMFIIITLCCMVGLTMFAYYETCDPLKAGRVKNANQLLPLFVMDILGDYSGVPGLFVASLFSGALSSVSSMLNSLSAVTWEDFLKLRFSHFSDRKAAIVTKLLGVVYGCVGVGMAFLIAQLKGTVLSASFKFNGALGAPLVAVFLLGAAFTSPNWLGALFGGLVGFGFTMWILLGSIISKPDLKFELPTANASCNITTFNASAFVYPTNFSVDTSKLEGLDRLYGISYIWPSAVGILSIVVLGLIISWATGPTKSEDVDESLQLQMFKKLYVFCCGSKSEESKSWLHDNIGEEIKVIHFEPIITADLKPSDDKPKDGMNKDDTNKAIVQNGTEKHISN